MKILYLAHRIPYPPNKGDKIRSFHEIQHLSREHELHLVAFCDQPEDHAHADALKRYCASVTLVPLDPRIQKLHAGIALLTGKPFTLGYFSTGAMTKALRQKLNEVRFDVIFVFCSAMAPYVENVADVVKILDFVDSDASKWAQYASAKKAPAKWLYDCEAKRLKEFEVRMLDRFDCCAFVSNREAAHLSNSYNNLIFVQNGVDLGFYSASPRDAASSKIVFTGAMDYFPNVDAVSFFANDVFPLVRRACPDAEFYIVGSRPAADVLKLSSIPGVTVTGAVKDVRPFLESARVAVAPLRISQGIQNKILEALATGMPVVASSNATAGLKPMNNIPFAVADEPSAFAQRVIDFLQRPPLSSEQMEQCREQLRKHYDWETNLNAFEDAMRRLTLTVGLSPANFATVNE